MKRTQHNSGFTLMEVVVATSLMAMLMTTLFLGLRLAASAWHKGESALAAHAQTMAGREMVERAVGAAVPRTLIETRDRKPVQLMSFSGTASEARFLTRRSWQADRSRPLFVAVLSVVKDAEHDRQQRLQVSELSITDATSMVAALEPSSLRALAMNQAKPVTELVGDPADKIELQYLLPGIGDKPAVWQSAWEPEKHEELPRALRVVWTRGKQISTDTFLVPTRREKPEMR